ncbi:MAG: LysM peptidoglycan-binding domain-containing protein, partial [Spirochaetota bacterium]
ASPAALPGGSDEGAGPAVAPALPAVPAVPAVPVGPAVPAALKDALYDLDIPWGEPAFEKWRAAYLGADGKKWLSVALGRGQPWMAYIMERIDFYRLPRELAWLPLIESEYSLRAVSKSGAAGLWQFMRNSIAGYGMRIDDWVDERRDFMKSTDAALRKLADNHASLHDWNLALAAYNMGLGAITRAVKASGSTDFFALRDGGYLSKETSSYVPKFLAVASILKYPARNGMPLDWSPPVEWESIELARPVDLGLLAAQAGLAPETLTSANAELRFAVTPPWKGYILKVPLGSADAVVKALDDPDAKLIQYAIHRVRSGDSVSALARAYGAPIAMVVEANPGLDPAKIRIGQTLLLPVLKEGATAPELAKPDLADETVEFGGTYIVQKGDSLWGIALKHEVRPETLAAKNSLELTSVLREGMVLEVPTIRP